MNSMYHKYRGKDFEIYDYVTDKCIKVYDYRNSRGVTTHKSMPRAAQYCLDNNLDHTLGEHLYLLKLKTE